jgi:D-alanyl-D-alanine carboxypeptidase
MNGVMALEALAAVQARMAEIRGTIASLAPPPSAAAGNAFATSFAAATATSNVSLMDRAAPQGELRVPPELASYGNGRIPLEMMQPVGDGSERLFGPAAAAFRRMASDAWRAGVDLRVSDGYRNIDDQHRLADELGLYRDGGLAAVPGTSTHGWGLSVDVDTDSAGAVEWLRENAAAYGFFDDVPGEPWHWTYRPS